MDITELYTAEGCDKGAEIQLINPITGDLTECFIKVSGIDSSAFRASEIKGRRKILDAKISDMSEDEVTLLQRKIIAETLADSTMGWRGFSNKGKDLPFSKKRAIELYLNSPKIGEQVDQFIAKRANFTEG